MEVIDSGLVFDARSAPENQRASFFLTMLRQSSGRILTGFRRGSTKESADGDCCLAESADGGRNWQIVCEGFRRSNDDRAVELRSVSLAEARDGTLRAFLFCLDRSGAGALYDAESDTLSPTSIRTMRSTDGGRNWRSEAPLDMGRRDSRCCPARPWLSPAGAGWSRLRSRSHKRPAGRACTARRRRSSETMVRWKESCTWPGTHGTGFSTTTSARPSVPRPTG